MKEEIRCPICTRLLARVESEGKTVHRNRRAQVELRDGVLRCECGGSVEVRSEPSEAVMRHV